MKGRLHFEDEAGKEAWNRRATVRQRRDGLDLSVELLS